MVDCLNNLHRCKASCCRSFSFNDGVIKERPGLHKIKIWLTKDMQSYYASQGCTYKHGILFLPIYLSDRVEWINGKTVIFRDCFYLDNETNLCKIHGNKPKCCSDLDETTKYKYRITENCLLIRQEESVCQIT